MVIILSCHVASILWYGIRERQCTGEIFAECELAWVRSGGTRIYKKNPNQLDRIHPTQKHIILYEFLLDNYAKEGDKILDTHLGSGSIAIACHNRGFELVACEIDSDYFDAAVKRINNHTAQQTIFDCGA